MGSWRQRRKVLLIDLDNTLYDWVAYFGPALRGMCRVLSEMTGLTSDVVFGELKAVFAAHGTVEYTFALQELPSLMAMHPDASPAEIVERYRAVVDVFQHRRRAYLRAYPGVTQGVAVLHEVGYEVYGVTDGRRFQAENRLRQLRLDRLLDGLCCVPDHATPNARTIGAIRRRPEEYYRSQLRRVVSLPPNVRKPSPAVLDYVLWSLDVQIDACIYVGDSLAKDIAMAQGAGMYDCWAEYGTRVSSLDLATLVRVTDWSPRAVREALRPSPQRLHIYPTFVASSFDSVVSLALMEPGERPRRRAAAPPPRQMSLLELGPALAAGGGLSG